MIKAINLSTEHLVDPIGIDVQKPHLYWNVSGANEQNAYQIVARCGETTVWDSGKVVSRSMKAELPVELRSREHIEWGVQLWDGEDNAGEMSCAFFEMGLVNPTDWKAQWITGDYSPNKRQRYPVDCFKKAFNAVNIKKARLYITACGLYEAKLNGKRVGNFVFAPGYTDYNKRIQYQTYDVTEMVQSGGNELTVELADGWYRGSCGAWGLTCQYGMQTKLRVQLELTDTNGKITYICSDKSWLWSSDGAIRFADNKDGEIVEAYRAPSYNGKAKLAKHNVTPTSSNNVPVTEHERLSVVEVIKTPSGATVLDFGQNIAGYVEFNVTAKQGQRVFLRFGEMLDKQGEFTQRNIQCVGKKKTTPLQQIEYICKDNENHYKTKFAVFGFRYALIETDVDYNTDDFTAIAVYSDMRETSKFSSSNALLNKFYENTLWSAKSNHLDIPTDCPTRERHGWTGDAQIFVGTATYMFNFMPFAKKYLRDLYDWQKKSGKLPQIAPYGGVDFYMTTMNGSVGWSDAGVIIPYTLWKRYGDKAVIEEFYDNMKCYAKFMISRCGGLTLLRMPVRMKCKYKKYLVNRGQSYGEWAEPQDVRPFSIADFIFPHPEESTAYTVYILRLMTEIADSLGKTEDKKFYERYAEGCMLAYRELIKKKKFSIDTDRQAKIVRPLYMNLLDKEQTEYAKNRLVKALENYGWRLGTGFLSTPLILDVLTKIDVEYAYKLLENEQMPGWLFMPRTGATTIWESWEGTEGQGTIASLNHYSKGACCQWLFSTMCGINVAGENKFIISPKLGGNFNYAKAEYDSVYGKVISGWERNGDKIVYTIKVPCNCTAEIVLPNGFKQTVGAGEYAL